MDTVDAPAAELGAWNISLRTRTAGNATTSQTKVGKFGNG